MGTWSAGITGNDTAQDLQSEYSAAFYRYDVEEALKRIDRYVRTEMFNESDEAEWCNYIYSLADFMWKKGILTEEIRQNAIRMIDSGFGLDIWAEESKKALAARQKALAEFRKKLLSPQPTRKKITLNIHPKRIFEDGDVIAVQLQTAGKPYTCAKDCPISEAEFHALDGKYILMQLENCYASWTSAIVPEVKDYWAKFRLFDGIYDSIPEHIDCASLKTVLIREGKKRCTSFTCESSTFYFSRRGCRVLCNRKNLIADTGSSPRGLGTQAMIFWDINKPWSNPDSHLVASIGLHVRCGNMH